ncbi:MAG: CBS domain-containing protein [Candidatus Aenigmatarchaeota archaeon]|nr:CBS domain-containing protein [Candidatus Aenigmarchaeota archaeon]
MKKTHKISKFVKKMKKKKNRHILHEVVKTEIERNYVDIETPIKNIMSTNLKVVEVGKNLREVIELLGDFEITGVPVRNGNKVVGVISDTDIMRVMQERGLLDPKKDTVNLSGLEKIKVEEVMSKPPITIYQNEKITDASDLMIKHKIDRLIVVDENNKTVGIVTREDVVKGLTSEFFLKSLKKSGENTINSNVDLMLSILRKKNQVSIKELSKEMKMNIKDLEDLIKILENKGLVEIVYPLLGWPKVKMVKK